MSFYEIDGVMPIVHPTAFVHESASIIGDVFIDADCYIGPFASLRADFGRITIGAGSNVQDSCVIHAFPGVDAILEPSSHVGHAAVLHGCIVREFALIGIGAIVLDGADIGSNALVGAGALVTAGTIVPPGTLVLGSPARVVRELDQSTKDWKIAGVGIYQDLARRSREGLKVVNPLTNMPAERPRVSTGRDVAIPLYERRRASRTKAE